MNIRIKHALSIVIIIAVGLFAACATKAKSPVMETSTLIGKWLWVQSSGGYAGGTETASESKTIKILTFDKDGTVSLIVNEKQELKDTYSLTRIKSIFSDKETDAIKYVNDSKVQSYQINGDTLFLSEECYDCYKHVYVKRK